MYEKIKNVVKNSIYFEHYFFRFTKTTSKNILALELRQYF